MQISALLGPLTAMLPATVRLTLARLFCSIVLCTLGGLGLVQSAHAKQDVLPQLKFSHIAQNELEALGHINDIVQDHEGYLWFGAAKGLARYDGYELEVFRQKEGLDGIPTSWVERLLISSQGQIWLTTRKGYCRFNALTANFSCAQLHSPSPDAEPTYDFLFEDSRNNLWLSSNQGVFTVNPESLKATLHPSTWLQNHARGSDVYLSTITEDNDGYLWLGHYDAGLSRFNPRTGEGINWRKGDAGLSSNKLRSLMVDQEGQLWIGTQGAGVVLFDTQRLQASSFSHNQAEKADTVWDIVQDQRGLVWIGDGTGVHLVSPTDRSIESHQFIEGKPLTPGNYVVRSLYEDKNGGIWIGYFPSGIDLVDEQGSQFVSYRHDPRVTTSLPDGGVLATLEAPNGDLWVGAGFGLGLLRRERNEFAHFKHEPKNPNSLSGSTILEMAYGPNGTLWLGAWDRGLNQFDPKSGRFKRYLPEADNPHSLLGREPWGILFDSQQRLWVTTEKGLNLYRPLTDDFRHYLPQNSSGQPVEAMYTRHVYEDRRGNIWVASFSGLQNVDPATGAFTTYRYDPQDDTSISSDMVSYVFEDSQNRLWVGTDGAGVNIFDRNTGQFKRYGIDHGLPDLSIVAIVEDTTGQIWMATYQGLVVFDPELGVVNHYKRGHGLPGNLFNRHSGALLSTGELAFGSSEGLVIFKPSQLKANEVPPALVFKELRIFNQPVKVGDATGILNRHINYTRQITLSHHQSVFSVSFAALDYRSPEDNSYAYRLLGFEKEWNWVDHQRSATYTNLDPGKYTLEVKAANSADIWNHHPKRLHITVVPPWWLTHWAKAFYVFTIVGLLAKLYFMQRSRLQSARAKLARERELVSKLRDVERMKDNLNRELDIKVSQRTAELSLEKERLLDAHSQLAALNEKLESMTVTDQLTGLKNRRYLNRAMLDDTALIRRLFQNGQPEDDSAGLVFVILDIDDFKSVNDTYGHDAGDRILVQLAEVLRSMMRQYDSIVRWGGEEFVLVMRHLKHRDIEACIDRLRTKISTTAFDIGRNDPIYKTVSIGYANYPIHPLYPDALTWEQVIGIADRALYACKRSGKNGWIGISAAHLQCRKGDIVNLADEEQLLELLSNKTLQVQTNLDSNKIHWR
ncbi:two-component regulator propeller domain-containing protein [Gilvimarinus sp. SDUM040013]|uniref:Two-component regulator propeller domain-containing protein n=1 Tax=Gilvimarinus gilvus TaxID=3058038 RepID=A0ABU4S171_9GAMM|nr:two-component regulator propeller domain-containing protein [Gilvimarinus sp. SDUM040013]MDO3387174.1 two-component regulator propeller domain-containing protein [Gilvimarinus sp. SDUM040013]MDX6850917.1 two-component regulator propeller domain-containing protein [Gilvimarinus sp. SDUM040013]